MVDITVTKIFELIITLNTHNFLFYYSHSTQWKLSLPLNCLLTFFNFEELKQQQQQQQNPKTTTYSFNKDMFFSFNAKHKVYIIKCIFGVWHYFHRTDRDHKYLVKNIPLQSQKTSLHYGRLQYNRELKDMALSVMLENIQTRASLNKSTVRKASISLSGSCCAFRVVMLLIIPVKLILRKFSLLKPNPTYMQDCGTSY